MMQQANKSKQAIASLWPIFSEEIQGRLRAGAEIYGDQSLELPNVRLIREIQEELFDVCGWSFILWQKLEEVKERFRELEKAAHG